MGAMRNRALVGAVTGACRITCLAFAEHIPHQLTYDRRTEQWRGSKYTSLPMAK